MNEKNKQSFKKFVAAQDAALLQKQEKVAKFIHANCKPYLRALSGVPLSNTFNLWRGSKLGEYEPGDVVKTRKNRNPLDSSAEFHNFVDNIFLKKFKHNFRSNAVFCTGNKPDAEHYGSAYMVVPMGNFRFLWSPKIADLYSSLGDTYDDFEDTVRDMKHMYVKNKFLPPDKMKSVMADIMKSAEEKFLKDTQYTDKDLVAAIKKKNEVMIACDKYLMIPRYVFDENWGDDGLTFLTTKFYKMLNG